MAEPRQNALDTFVEIGSQVGAAIGVWMPHVRIGVAVAKFLIDKFNERPDVNDEPITITDEELIARVEERAQRIVDTGTAALDRWKRDAEASH